LTHDQAAVAAAHAFNERRGSERKESARRIALKLYSDVAAAQVVRVPVEEVIAEALLQFADDVLEAERGYMKRDAKAALTGALKAFERQMKQALEPARAYAERLVDK